MTDSRSLAAFCGFVNFVNKINKRHEAKLRRVRAKFVLVAAHALAAGALGGVPAHAQTPPGVAGAGALSSQSTALAASKNASKDFQKPLGPIQVSSKVQAAQRPASPDTSGISGMLAAAQAGKYPPPIETMLAKGKSVKVLDAFDAQGGLTGFVLSAGQAERRLYYVTPDGAVAIYGMAFDRALNNLTARDYVKYTNPLSNTTGVGTLLAPGAPAGGEKTTPATGAAPLASVPRAALAKDDLWSVSALDAVSSAKPSIVAPSFLDRALALATKSQGVLIEGKGLPVYIVFDLACPYCHRTYKATRALLGQLQIHWIPVGALGPRSQLLAQAFLGSKDKGAALASAVSGELVPAPSLSIEAAALINENADILKMADSTSVPLTLYLDRGQARKISGALSAAQLQELVRIAGITGLTGIAGVR